MLFEEQYELRKDISDSFEELEYEREYTRRALGREQEQRSMLDKLGLSEVEAVQYLLMISRDEEESRRRTVDGDGTCVGGEVYEGDFDNLLGTGTNPGSPSSSTHVTERRSPRVVSPTSNEKVQISAPLDLEPMDAGPSTTSTKSPDAVDVDVSARTPSTSSFEDFPAMSSSTSSLSSSKESGNTSSVHLGSQGSPIRARESAWSRPTRSVLSPGARSDTGASSRRGARRDGRASTTGFLSGSGTPTRSLDDAPYKRGRITPQSGGNDIDTLEEMDDEMRFVIELSLAEARSREV